MKHSRLISALTSLTAAFLLLAASGSSLALITGSHGNRPVENMGWPLGCEKVANLPSRLGWWEGRGDYHFLYRCQDTTEFNQALEIFSAIRAPRPLQLVVHDGPEHSFWLKPGGDNDLERLGGGLQEEEKTRVDWTFTVWNPASWHRLFSNPTLVFSDHPNFRQPVPAPQIDVYIGGGVTIVWKEVKVLPNLAVIDRRAEAAPIKPVGGGLVSGAVRSSPRHNKRGGRSSHRQDPCRSLRNPHPGVRLRFPNPGLL